jgi:hypothetical protein
MPQNKILSILVLFFLVPLSLFSQGTIIKYLSGTDKDHTVSWDFFCDKGMGSGKWSHIAVPSCWELQGFGSYNYGHDKNPSDEVGTYRYTFTTSKSWKGKKVNIVFDGVMTDALVKINGQQAGNIHQGAFYQFKYDISDLLKYGQKNLLEVKVSKRSQNKSINGAERSGDFWVFGGIFRPVLLEILPAHHIERLAINAQADGDFQMQVFTNTQHNNYKLEAVLTDLGTNKVMDSISVPIYKSANYTELKHHFEHVKLWSPEFPHLYKVQTLLKDEAGNIIHQVSQNFGFRTVELRPHDGFYLNGKKVLFKGVDHHSFWPETGRTTSKDLSRQDITLMKEMNMNAVRMSHYPPDSYFLSLCDSMGLMVLDELTGWQHYYDDSTGHRLVKEMLLRDINHPSIVIWDNGNEGGFNRHLDNDYALYDLQKRLVIHPWEKFNGTNTKHYPDYNYLVNTALYGTEVFFPTESLHGLYDGGAGAGLDDYWNLMSRDPHSAGTFIWVFADEGIVRKDKNDSIDTDGNHAPDGILGPHREKEGSFYAIKEIWSPVTVEAKPLDKHFDGKLFVKNRYLFTNLNQCKFQWKLVRFAQPAQKSTSLQIDATGTASISSVAPGETGTLNLALPTSWKSSDALYLTAYDPHGKLIFTWSWPVKSPSDIVHMVLKNKKSTGALTIYNAADTLKIIDGDLQYYFNKTSGFIEKVIRNDSALSLSGGPALAGLDQKLTEFKTTKSGRVYLIEATYKGENNRMNVRWTFDPGMPVKLEYSYNQRGQADFMGITFNYPADKITGMRWLGRGPYHVWKNRLKGLKLGVWDKAYNNTITGESWNYPEFKGNHENLYWVTVHTKEFPFTVFTENRNLFLQMLKTPDPKGAGNNHTTVNYPKGDIGFLNAIQPIGTKFHEAASMGPQSQKNILLNGDYHGTLWFDFR